MIYKLLLGLFIGFISYAATSNGDGQFINREIADSNCSTPGYMCRSCSDVAFCIELPGGNWIKQDLYTCEKGTTCLRQTGNCTSLANPDCEIPDEQYTFTCHQVGIFPDAVSCFEYHICKNKEGSIEVDPTSIQMKCEPGYYFDALTTLCRFKSINGLCPPTVNCTRLGQTGVVSGNPSLFYVCLKSPVELYPQIFTCANDLIYNTTTNSCVDRYRPPTAAGPDGKCKTRGLFYDPADCHNYFECGAVGATPLPRKCATKLYFNTTTSTCVDFKCTDFQ